MSTETRTLQAAQYRVYLDCARAPHHHDVLELAEEEGVPAERLLCLVCGGAMGIREIGCPGLEELLAREEPEGDALLLKYLESVLRRASPEDLPTLERGVDALAAFVHERNSKWQEERRAAEAQALVGQFLAVRCELTQGGSTTAQRLHNAFRRWCRQQNMSSPLDRWEKFDGELGRRGYSVSGDPPCYQGIVLKPEQAKARRRAASNSGPSV